MQNPFSLLQRYFRTAAGLPDASGIGDPTLLAAIVAIVTATMGGLKLVSLTAPERVRFRQKGSGNQQQISSAIVHLLGRRPQLKTESQVDPDTLTAIIQRGDDLAILSYALDQTAQAITDSLLLVRAALCHSTSLVSDYISSLQDSGTTDPTLLRKLLICFAPVNLAAIEEADKKAKKARINQKRQQAGAQGQAQNQQELAAQPAVERLIGDARKGYIPGVQGGNS